jgi:hypothetical protein
MVGASPVMSVSPGRLPGRNVGASQAIKPKLLISTVSAAGIEPTTFVRSSLEQDRIFREDEWLSRFSLRFNANNKVPLELK